MSLKTLSDLGVRPSIGADDITLIPTRAKELVSPMIGRISPSLLIQNKKDSIVSPALPTQKKKEDQFSSLISNKENSCP